MAVRLDCESERSKQTYELLRSLRGSSRLPSATRKSRKTSRKPAPKCLEQKLTIWIAHYSHSSKMFGAQPSRTTLNAMRHMATWMTIGVWIGAASVGGSAMYIRLSTCR